MNRIKIAALIAVPVIVLGGSIAAVVVDMQRDARAQEERDERKEQAAQEKEEEKQALLAANRDCLAATEPYLQSVQAVAAVVEAGVSYNDYSSLLQAAAIASRQVPAVLPDCQSEIVDALDAALVEYLEAGTRWEDCIFGDAECDVDALDLSADLVPAAVSVQTAEIQADVMSALS